MSSYLCYREKYFSQQLDTLSNASSALLRTFSSEKKPLFSTLSTSISQNILEVSRVNGHWILQIYYSTTEKEYMMKGVAYLDFLMNCLSMCMATLSLEGLKSFICMVLVRSSAINTARMGCFIFYSPSTTSLSLSQLISTSSIMLVNSFTLLVISYLSIQKSSSQISYYILTNSHELIKRVE